MESYKSCSPFNVYILCVFTEKPYSKPMESNVVYIPIFTFLVCLRTGVIRYQNRYLCCRPSRYCVKLLSTEDYGFRPSRTDVDRGTTSLNALKMRYFSVYFYIFGVQAVSEIVCYCLSGLDVWL